MPCGLILYHFSSGPVRNLKALLITLPCAPVHIPMLLSGVFTLYDLYIACYHKLFSNTIKSTQCQVEYFMASEGQYGSAEL